MPQRSWIDEDFQAFRANVLLSFSPNVPLQDNLRAVMVPALAKLRLYTKASVVVHIFTNPTFKEVHALVCGMSRKTLDTVRRERLRREQAADLWPVQDLPNYLSHRLDTIDSTASLFKSCDEEYAVKLQTEKELLHDMKHIAGNASEEFENQQPKGNDLVIILPLRSMEYQRLGYIVLWSPEKALQLTADRSEDRETRCMFQSRLRQVLVRIFTNYYRMTKQTYLPSYYRPGGKDVTLFCAEIREFDRIWTNIETHNGLNEFNKVDCKLQLMQEFAEIVARTVEEHSGRVDQNWGSGSLAIFGEYLDLPDASPRPGLKRALTAALEVNAKVERYAEVWLRDRFKEQMFRALNIRRCITPAPVIAIDYGPVLFDYFGSSNHKIFMGVGEHVSFVKQLAATAGKLRPPSKERLQVRLGMCVGFRNVPRSI